MTESNIDESNDSTFIDCTENDENDDNLSSEILFSQMLFQDHSTSNISKRDCSGNDDLLSTIPLLIKVSLRN